MQRCTRHTKSQPRTNSNGKQSLCQATDRKEEDFWCSELMQAIIIIFLFFFFLLKCQKILCCKTSSPRWTLSHTLGKIKLLLKWKRYNLLVWQNIVAEIYQKCNQEIKTRVRTDSLTPKQKNSKPRKISWNENNSLALNNQQEVFASPMSQSPAELPQT